MSNFRNKRRKADIPHSAEQLVTDVLRANSRSIASNSITFLMTNSRSRATRTAWHLGSLSGIATVLCLVELAWCIASNDAVDLVLIDMKG